MDLDSSKERSRVETIPLHWHGPYIPNHLLYDASEAELPNKTYCCLSFEGAFRTNINNVVNYPLALFCLHLGGNKNTASRDKLALHLERNVSNTSERMAVS